MMTYQEACEILEIEKKDNITADLIKKQYRIKALLFHPDKNNSPDASSKFQDIHSAYELLIKSKEYDWSIDMDNDVNESTSSYKDLLFTFLKNVLRNETRNELFTTILQRLSNSCEEKVMKTLEQLDKTTLIKIYDIILKYWKVLHFGEEMLRKIEKIIKEKTKNDECIILNPTLEDLFENNLYRLPFGEFTYIVPLWHHELVYDNSGNDVIVKCFPVLEDHIYIDEMNNIHVEISVSISELWGKDNYVIVVGSKEFTINQQQLKLRKNQTVVFPKKGISMINTKDVYDISKMTDVNVHIELSL